MHALISRTRAGYLKRRRALRSSGTSRVRRTALIATAAIAVLVAGGFTARWLWAPSAPASSRQFVLLPPDGSNFGEGPADRTPPFALSPDGTRLAFMATTNSRSGIWIRSLDSLRHCSSLERRA